MQSDSPPAPMFEPDSNGPGIKEVIDALGRHWPLIVSSGILCLLVGYVYTAFRTRSFVSDASVYLIAGPESRTPSLVAANVEMPRQAPIRDNALELLRGRTLASRIVERIGWRRIIGDVNSNGAMSDAEVVSDSGGVALAMQRFKSSFFVDAVREADVIRMTYAASSSKLAQDCLDAAIDEFQKLFLEFTRYDDQVHVLEKDLGQRLAAVGESRRALDEAKNAAGVFDLDSQRGDWLKDLGDLTKDLNALEDEEAQLKSQKTVKEEFLKTRRDADNPVATEVKRPNPLWDERWANVEKARQSFDSLKGDYSPNDRQYNEARQRLTTLSELLETTPKNFVEVVEAESDPKIDELVIDLAEIEATLAGIQARVERMRPRVTSLSADIDDLKNHEGKILSLTESHAIAREDLSSLREKLADVKTNQSFNRAGALNLRIVESPNLPLHPEGLSSPMIWAVLGFIGALIGLAVAFLKEVVRESFNDEDELRAALGVEEIIVFPDVSRSNLRKLPSA